MLYETEQTKLYHMKSIMLKSCDSRFYGISGSSVHPNFFLQSNFSVSKFTKNKALVHISALKFAGILMVLSIFLWRSTYQHIEKLSYSNKNRFYLQS